MVEPKITMGRMPSRPASQPATMPPKAAPTYDSEPAPAGPDRLVCSSAAICFIATTTTSGAP